MDNCCCKNVRDNEECDSDVSCGINPEVFVMSPDDAEVVCKEWEIEDGDGEDELLFQIEVKGMINPTPLGLRAVNYCRGGRFPPFL